MANNNSISDITVNISVEDVVNSAAFGGICLYKPLDEGETELYTEVYGYDEAEETLEGQSYSEDLLSMAQIAFSQEDVPEKISILACPVSSIEDYLNKEWRYLIISTTDMSVIKETAAYIESCGAYKVLAVDLCAADIGGVFAWNPTVSTETDGVTISGNYWSSASNYPITYGDLTLTKALKMESSTSVSFTASAQGTLTLVCYSTSANPTIVVDETTYSLTASDDAETDTYATSDEVLALFGWSDGTSSSSDDSNAYILEISIEAGDHTITKGTASTYLYYMKFSIEGILSGAYDDYAANIDTFKSYERTFAYVGRAAYDDGAVLCNSICTALLAETSGKDVGSFTYKNIPLKSVYADEDITKAKLAEYHSNNVNAFVTKAGYDVTSEGVLANGEYIDILDCKDWLITQIKYQLQQLLIINDKIPYTNNGIAQLETCVVNILKSAFNSGMIAEDDDGQAAYTVSFPGRSETDASDRELRQYVLGEFSFELAGAIHTVTVNGTITI